MSALTNKRQAVVDILNGFDYLKAYGFPRATPKAGNAWYAQGPVEVDQRSSQFFHNFQVLLVTPQSTEEAAYAWMSDHWEEVVEALAPEGFTDRVEMVLVAADNESRGMWAVQITLRSE